MPTTTAPTTKLTDVQCKNATGKTLKQWFAFLDEREALQAGRREATKMLQAEGLKDDWWLITIAAEYEIAKGIVEKDGKPKGYAICATKTINAPIDTVYEAWTTAQQLSQWLGAKCTIDLKVDGQFKCADGQGGEFKRIRENKDLRFTWLHDSMSPGSLVDVAFAAKGDTKTGITLNHARIQSRADADALRASWGSSLDALKAHLEE